MEQKYRALRLIGGLYFILGVLVLIFGSLAAFGTAALTSPAYAYGMTPNVGGTSPINLFLGVAMEVAVLMVGIGLIAVAQLVQLLLGLNEKASASEERQDEQLKLMRMLVQQGQSIQR